MLNLEMLASHPATVQKFKSFDSSQHDFPTTYDILTSHIFFFSFGDFLVVCHQTFLNTRHGCQIT